jgi:hypothetical protein
MTGICAVKKGDELWVFDEIIMTGGATTWDFAEEVIDRYSVERRIVACRTTQSSANPAFPSLAPATPGKSATRLPPSTPPSSTPAVPAAAKSTPAAKN